MNEKNGAITLEALKAIFAVMDNDKGIGLGVQDVREVLRDAEAVLEATGSGSGKNRVEAAAKDAERKLKERGLSAKALIAVVEGDGKEDLLSIHSALSGLNDLGGDDILMIWGYVPKDTLKDEARVTVVATA